MSKNWRQNKKTQALVYIERTIAKVRIPERRLGESNGLDSTVAELNADRASYREELKQEAIMRYLEGGCLPSTAIRRAARFLAKQHRELSGGGNTITLDELEQVLVLEDE